MHLNANAGSIISVNRHVSRVNCGQDTWPYSYCEYCYQDTVEPRVSFYTGTGNEVPRLVTNLTDFFEENKEFSMILGKIWNFNVVSD